nr:MAG TPA: hypothetical protein [Caudoviricetes sp.]DAN69842.1 MAG TPA: hypothetical protein [Caudoviricetes sp.]
MRVGTWKPYACCIILLPFSGYSPLYASKLHLSSALRYIYFNRKPE